MKLLKKKILLLGKDTRHALKQRVSEYTYLGKKTTEKQ